MGIQGLLPFLRKRHAHKAFQQWPHGAGLAIDVPIFAHKFVYTERTYARLEARMLAFAKDLSQTATPIFVFDGARLALKDRERQKRAKARDAQLERQHVKTTQLLVEALESANAMIVDEAGSEILDFAFGSMTDFQGLMFPTRHEYTQLRAALEANGYECRVAAYEAEALCAHLTRTNVTWATLTEDSDALAFGCPRTIFRYFAEPFVLEHAHVLDVLGMTNEQFTEFCCMLGCDFCDNVFKIGPETAFRLLTRYGSWAKAYDASRYKWSTETLESAIVFDSRLQYVKDCFETAGFEAYEAVVGSVLESLVIATEKNVS